MPTYAGRRVVDKSDAHARPGSVVRLSECLVTGRLATSQRQTASLRRFLP